MENDPFKLFCLYYLGVTPEDGYRFANANRVAARLNCTVDELMRTLRRLGLHPDVVLNTDFPMARYQVDVQIAVESKDPDWLMDFAERIYNEFLTHAGKSRDWLAEIEKERQTDRGRGRN